MSLVLGRKKSWRWNLYERSFSRLLLTRWILIKFNGLLLWPTQFILWNLDLVQYQIYWQESKCIWQNDLWWDLLATNNAIDCCGYSWFNCTTVQCCNCKRWLSQGGAYITISKLLQICHYVLSMSLSFFCCIFCLSSLCLLILFQCHLHYLYVRRFCCHCHHYFHGLNFRQCQ